jgi:flagellar motor switch protein FliM
MPKDSIRLGVVGLEPGGHLAVTDIASHLGFAMLDLLLGGTGLPAGFRAFTDLEGILLTEVVGHIGWAVRAAFATLIEFEPTIADIQSRAAIGHVSVPSDSVLVLSFRIRLDAPHPSEGILSVCYPRHLLEAVLASRQTTTEGETEPTALGSITTPVKEAPIELKARINGSKLTLGELAMLQPGDVVVLGHAADEPALVGSGDIELFEGDVGRYNGRMALRLTKWMAT